uniref:FTH domain-containing protein n=1 Tax=Rhabditophanes sp. KR3021 TaxID=114890 RepID=A0AC35TJF6_9BILA
MSFRDFIYTHRNEVFQMKRRAHFAIYSESREGNYDTDDWARFLNANEIEKLEFTCLEHICIEDLIEFVRFMLRATRNKQIREFVINLEASHYTPYQINVMQFFGLQDYHFVKGKIIQTHYVITMMKFANPAQNNVINQSGVILYFHGDFVKR